MKALKRATLLTASLLFFAVLAPVKGFAFLDSLAGELLGAAFSGIAKNLAAKTMQNAMQGLSGVKPIDTGISEKKSKVWESDEFLRAGDPCHGLITTQDKDAVISYFKELSPTPVSIEAVRFTFKGQAKPLNFWAKRSEVRKILAELKPKLRGQAIVISSIGMAFPARVSGCAWVVPVIPTEEKASKIDWLKVSDNELVDLVAWVFDPEMNIWPQPNGSIAPVDLSATTVAESLFEQHQLGCSFLAMATTLEDPQAQLAMQKRDNYWVAPRNMSKMPEILLGKWYGKREDGSAIMINFRKDKFLDFGADKDMEVIVNPMGKGRYLVAIGEDEEGVVPGTKDCELIDGVFYWGLKNAAKHMGFRRS